MMQPSFEFHSKFSGWNILKVVIFINQSLHINWIHIYYGKVSLDINFLSKTSLYNLILNKLDIQDESVASNIAFITVLQNLICTLFGWLCKEWQLAIFSVLYCILPQSNSFKNHTHLLVCYFVDKKYSLIDAWQDSLF